MLKLVKWFWIFVCRWILSILMLAILVLSVWNLVDYWRTSDWVRVDGTINSFRISDVDGSEPDLNWSGRGKLPCQYTYTFQGRNYSGNRVGVETFDVPTRRAHRYRKLKAQLDEGGPIAVLVNPTAPTESALFREVLSDFYFGPAIGLMWFGALFWDYKRSSKKRGSRK